MNLALELFLAALLGLLAGVVLGRAWSWGFGPAGANRLGQHQVASAERAAVEALVRPLSDTLGRVSDQLARAEVERASAQAELREQVRRTAEGAESLRGETGRLVSALRRSEVRGRWGEVQLRRLVESAGLIEHVDFTEQHSTRGEDGDGTMRPDLVVHLADGRHVVVDAKVALSAYLDAAAATNDTDREAALARHAREVLAHVDRLSTKAYWARYDSPEFVVLFLPADAFLSSALDVTPDLLEQAFARDVVLATPTTLLALLRTVSYAWRQDAAARNAAQVHALGRELHTRLVTMSGHLAGLGSALERSVEQFNRTVGSWDSRVLVSARRLADLGVVPGGDDDAGLPHPRSVTTSSRSVPVPLEYDQDVLPCVDPTVPDTPAPVPYR